MVECEVSKTCLVYEAPVCAVVPSYYAFPSSEDLVVAQAAQRERKYGGRGAGSRKEKRWFRRGSGQGKRAFAAPRCPALRIKHTVHDLGHPPA